LTLVLTRVLPAFCLLQYALKKFAESFEVVPKTLAENAGASLCVSLSLHCCSCPSDRVVFGMPAGLVAVDTISQLYAAHERGDTKAGISIDVRGPC
jgi:chaperonin GroEL (HSP60 family)